LLPVKLTLGTFDPFSSELPIDGPIILEK